MGAAMHVPHLQIMGAPAVDQMHRALAGKSVLKRQQNCKRHRTTLAFCL